MVRFKRSGSRPQLDLSKAAIQGNSEEKDPTILLPNQFDDISHLALDEKELIILASSIEYCFGRTPVDRPIIRMVAAHWNEDESSHISPKWWDGNGIPNSTKKYKEDQKVSWHATPFEERLKKALSGQLGTLRGSFSTL
ncbi:hypothetical protein COLO4_37405 [Corchorus olitorius]|uniref:Uncharacterized protein n=1 Tax=Corchorus olitorius TaxID=93759 RepID=A0A1R3G211_9ROSI|nr:hypothetical protein COLO4_37405 [Corchorus olitorius]